MKRNFLLETNPRTKRKYNSHELNFLHSSREFPSSNARRLGSYNDPTTYNATCKLNSDHQIVFFFHSKVCKGNYSIAIGWNLLSTMNEIGRNKVKHT